MGGLDIFFGSDILNHLAALALANSRAMGWARRFGANSRDIAIVQAAYQAALADVGVSFGLQRPAILTLLNEETAKAGLPFWAEEERGVVEQQETSS